MSHNHSMHSGTADDRGHLFIINGDIRRLQCDAWLLPTSQGFWVTASFASALGMDGPGSIPSHIRPNWDLRSVTPLESWNEAHPNDPDIWLGDVGRFSDTEIDHFIGRAEDFIVTASEHYPTPVHRRLTLALPIVGTGDGGGAQRRGEILGALIPTLLDLAESHKVDIILVAWGAVAYSAAQKARRLALAQRGDKRTTWPTIAGHLDAADRLVTEAERGNLVVFIGAGVSASAGLPAWQELLDDVADRVGYDAAMLPYLHQLDVRDQAAVLGQRCADKSEFTRIVQEVLDSSHYSLIHGLIASLPVREIVTTNFDRLFEAAAMQGHASLDVLPGNRAQLGNRWLAKLHGDLGSDLVLTRSEYQEARLRNSALFGLVQALLITRHMLFVGYSLRDEDFNEVIHEVRSVRPEGDTSLLGTALMPASNPAMATLWTDLTILTPSESPANVVDGRVVEPTSAELVEVARWQAILLDYVASEAASDISFITNPDYNVDDGVEAELAHIVRRLRNLLERSEANGADWREVRQFIDSFEFDDPDDATRIRY